MTQQTVAKYFVASGILIIISTFIQLVNLVNSYDAFIRASSHAVAAFDG